MSILSAPGRGAPQPSSPLSLLISELLADASTQVLARDVVAMVEVGSSPLGSDGGYVPTLAELESLERAAESTSYRSRDRIGQLDALSGTLVKKALHNCSSHHEEGAGGSCGLPPSLDVHVQWMPGGNEEGAVAEVVVRDAAAVQRGLAQQWIAASLRGRTTTFARTTATVSSRSSSASPEQLPCGDGSCCRLGGAVVIVNQSPLNCYAKLCIGHEETMEGNVVDSGRVGGGRGGRRGAPLQGLGFLDGLQHKAAPTTVTSPTSSSPTEMFPTVTDPPPPLPTPQSVDGLLCVHNSMQPDVGLIGKALRTALIIAPPPTEGHSPNKDISEAATDTIMATLQGTASRASNGHHACWITSSIAGPTSSSPAPTAGQKRPRLTSTSSSEYAPLKSSRLGLVSVQYLVVSVDGADDSQQAITVGGTSYQLVTAFRAVAEAEAKGGGSSDGSGVPVSSQSAVPDDPSSMADEGLDPLAPVAVPNVITELPLTLASTLPALVVNPTRERDFVANLIRFDSRV